MGKYSPLLPLERSMLFQPSQILVPIQNAEVEQVEFESIDGTKIHGVFIEHQVPKAVVLFCHGNAGNISQRAESLVETSQRHQISMMTFDYRGYGESEGTPIESGIYMDARAARKWLSDRSGVAESDIVLMGRSLGGAVAIDLAGLDGAKGLVLHSTFTSMPAVAQNLIPWLPARLLMTQRFDSLSKLRKYDGPVLQSHGDKDNLIPIEIGLALYSAAAGRKQFVVIENGGHNSPLSEEYRIAFDRFLDQLD